MSLAETSIRNPVFAWMLMAFLVVFGGISFNRLGVSQMPDVDFPQVQVSLNLEGASPEIVESDVLDPIEDEIQGVEGVREINAVARHGRGSLSIEFHLDKDIDVAVQEIQTKIAQAGSRLPRELDPPIVSKQNADDQPFIFVALSGTVPFQQLVLYAKDQLKPMLQKIPGAGEISLRGYLERNMRVWVRLEELESRELAVEDVLSALDREHVEVPAGRLEGATGEMSVRSVGEAPSAAEFRQIVVAYRRGSPVLLGDVATVEDGLADRRQGARALGVPAIGLGVKKQFGANAIEVARGVRALVASLPGRLPPGVLVEVNSDMTVFIEEAIHEIQFNLVLSVVLTSVVCWLFLGSWSSTFNVLLAIPTSIVGAFIFIDFLGFTLNTFTLLALSLAIGIVVDDAIMVLENIVRHREAGAPRVRAAGEGAKEITLAAVAATLSIMAIFLPIAFMRGLIGKFLYQFGVTLSVAVALSLLEALTLTPMRCSRMLEVRAEGAGGFAGLVDRFFRALARLYRATLAPCLRHRWAVLALAFAGFAASLWVARTLPQEIVPAQDQSMLLVRLQTPTGSALEYTDERLRAIEQHLEDQRGAGPVNRYFAFIGGLSGGDVESAMIFLTLKPRQERPAGPMGTPWTQAEFQAALRKRILAIPGFRSATVGDLSMRGLTARGGSFPIQFSITGPEWERLGGLSDEFMGRMRDSGLMIDVNSDYQTGMPEVRLYPDRRRAADLGVSAVSIGNTVNALVGGVRAGKFKEGGHRYDVRVRLQSDQRSRPEHLQRLTVRNKEGRLVRLSEVVQMREQATVQQITRRNRQRSVTVSANLVPGRSQKDANDAVQAIAAELLPPGYGIDVTGSSALFKDAGRDFLVAIVLGVVVAYMILASQFNSFVHPLLVLLAMPFSLTGAVLALHVAGASLNMYSMIGVVLLMGIVKKNSILIVEFANQLRERGRGTASALLRAGPVRLRPILMTTVSTIAAALPPAFALGPGSETVRSMALVVIGGVALSALLTLYVVPAAYFILPGRVRGPREAA